MSNEAAVQSGPVIQENRWWLCREDDALCDGESDHSECWNCGWVIRGKKVPWAELELFTCTDGCPAGTQHVGIVGEHFCPYYLEHHGRDAYYDPSRPIVYILDMNGLRYDEETDAIVPISEGD